MELTADTINLVDGYRTDFATKFAKAELGMIMKNIISASIADKNLLSDDSYVGMINKAANEVADAAFDNYSDSGDKTSTGSNFIDSLKIVVEENVNQESLIRQDIAHQRIASGDIQVQSTEGKEMLESIFGKHRFSTNEQRQRYRDEINIILSTEGKDIIETIQKDVTDAVLQTEEKNQIINVTVKAIKEEKENLQKLVDDETKDDEEKPDNSDDVGADDQDDIEGSNTDDGEGDVDDSEGDDTDEGESEEDEDEEEMAEESYAFLKAIFSKEQLDELGIEPKEDPNEVNPINEEPEDVAAYETDEFYNRGTGVEALLIANGKRYAYEGFNHEDEVSEEDEEDFEKAGEDLWKSKPVTAEVLKHAYSNENVACTLVPASPYKFEELKVPTLKELTSIYAKSSEDLKEIITARFDNLKNILKIEGDEELNKKYEEYRNRSEEAFGRVYGVNAALFSLGLTPYGLMSTEDANAIFIAKNIIRNLRDKPRYKNAKRTWDKGSRGVEDAYNAFFDILLYKKRQQKAKSRLDKEFYGAEVKSRESIFYENLAEIPREDVDKISQIKMLEEVDFAQALAVPNFIENVRISLTETSVKADVPINPIERIYERAKADVTEFLEREPNPEELKIIEAMCSETDASDFASNIFEKFSINIGNADFKANDGKLGTEDFKHIKNKALIKSTVYFTLKRLNILSEENDRKANTVHLM